MNVSNVAVRKRIPYAWEMLALLWLTFFLHQADRRIYNNLLPLILADLRLDDVQLGLVALVLKVDGGLVCRVAR